jgi:hypothetical protein
MTSEEHLQTSDILSFREKRLSATEHTAATRHLLQCPECRDRLPMPTADDLWRAVMGTDEEPQETAGLGSAWTSPKAYLAGTIFGRPAVRNSVTAGLLLFAILGFSLFLMMPEGSSVNEKLIGAVADNNSPYPLDPRTPDGPIHNEVSNTDVSTSSLGSNRRDLKTTDRKPSKAAVTPAKQAVPKPSNRGFPTARSMQQAETRGNVPCGGQRSVGLEARHTEEGLMLKWDKITGAISYNVYLSDLDERLIDHFETADKTSHVVRTKLDEETVYRLRLIAKLENGERIVSESQNFKFSDLAKGSSQSLGKTGSKKTSASVRCVEVKQ